VQDLRKTTGLDVSDRIVLHLTGLDDLSDWFDVLASEVLASDVVIGAGTGEPTALDIDDERVAFAWIAKA